MYYRLKSLSLVTATLLLSLTSAFLPPTLSLSPLVAQAQTTEDKEAQANRLFQTGIEQFRKGQLQQALQTYQQVLGIRRELGNSLQEAETLNQFGEVYNGLSQYAQAQDVLQQALAIFRQQKHRLGEGLALNHLGESYRNLGQLQTALKHHEQALAMMRELSNRTQEGATLHNIASVYETQEQYENAIKFYEQALVIQREVKDRAGEGRTLIGLGNTYIRWQRYQNSFDNSDKDLKLYQDALKSYEQALVIMREIGERVGEGWSLNGLGITYTTLGKREDGLKFYEQALAIMREVGNRAGEAAVLLNIGKAQDAKIDPLRENRDISLDFYEQVLAIVREIGHRPLEAEILNRIGLTYLWGGRQGGLETALEFYQQSLAVVREVGNRPLESIILNNIGRIYNGLGQLQTAQEYREQALAIRRELGIEEEPSPGEVATLVTYRTAKDQFTLVTRLEGEAVTHYKQGDAHAIRQRYQAALESYQQALAIVRQQKNRPWEWVILNQMGKAYQELGQLQLAFEAYQQSVVIRREVYKQGQQEPIPYTIRVASLVHTVSPDFNIEGILLEEAIANGVIRLGEGEPITTPIKITEGLKVKAGWPGSPDFSLQNEEEETLTNIGTIYQTLGQYQAALKPYKEALAIVREETDGDYHEQGQIIFNQMGKVYEKLGQHQAALESYQQALEIAKSGEGSSDKIPILLTQIGKAYETLKQYQAALESYQQALAIAQRDREYYRSQEEGLRRIGIAYEKPDEEAILNSIGAVYEKLGQPQTAQEYRQRALAFRREMGNPPEQITMGKAILITEIGTNENKETLVQINRLEGEGATLFSAGNTNSIQGQNQAALESYQQALTIVRQQNNCPWEGVILHQMGSVYQKLGQNKAALESYQQALVFIQELNNRAGEKATLLMRFGGAGAGDVVEIRSESGQVTTFNNAGGVILLAPEAEDIVIEIGNVYKALGQNQAALKSYEQALEIVRNGGGYLFKEEEILSNIASIYDNLDYQSALESYQELLANSQSRKELILNSIGTVYKKLGQYQASLESYEQALAIVREQKQRSPNIILDNTEGIILNNIGAVYEDLGQYQAALESYQQALAIVRDLSWRQTALINIGSVYEKMGQHQVALESFEQALAVARGVKDRPVEGITLLHKGKVYQRMGQHQAALESYQQALAIMREVGNRSGEGQALNNIGEAYHHLGQYQTALGYYQQALAIREEVGDRAGKGVTLNNIGATLEKQNQSELAIIFYKQSVNVTEAIRQDIKGLSQEQQQSYTETIAEDYRHLADLLLQQNRILEAQRVLDLLKVQELDDYLRNVRGTRGTAQGVPNLPPEQQIEDNYQGILDQAIALGKELTQLRQKGNRTPEDEQRIAQLVKAQEKITENFNNFIESDEVEALISQLTSKTRKPDLVNALEDLLSIQNNLKNLQQNAVLFYPLILEDRVELILTTPDSPPIRRTVPVTKKQLSQTILNFRQALQNPTSDAKIPAQQLYNWLIKPLENDLKAAEAKTIIYAPDGQLRYIPLAALHDGEQWLVQRYRINNITAASLTELNTRPQPQLKILAGAFTTGRHSVTVGTERFNFGGLPYAGVEVETLAKTIPNTTQLLNNAFNPEDTKPKMGDYTVLHFATHGAIVVGTPEESFILFGDGTPVTITDIRSWNLNNVDLVVLSACETGLGGKLGNGEEILGLGYQMQRAGARAAIASLWTVDDGGTQALMNAFYSNLKQSHTTKAEALRQAQIALITGNYRALGQQRGLGVQQPIQSRLTSRAASNLSHPYYWAPFILIGNGL